MRLLTIMYCSYSCNVMDVANSCMWRSFSTKISKEMIVLEGGSTFSLDFLPSPSLFWFEGRPLQLKWCLHLSFSFASIKILTSFSQRFSAYCFGPQSPTCSALRSPILATCHQIWKRMRDDVFIFAWLLLSLSFDLFLQRWGSFAAPVAAVWV